MLSLETMNRMYVFLLPMLPGEDLDARPPLGYLFHSSGINNAHRQAFTGFWFAISKGRRKCAGSLLIEWSSCTFMKWVGMILPLSFFFDVLFCMCNVYISTSEEPTWLKACLRLGTKQKVFLFAKLWTLLPEARWSTSKAKGILCQHLKLTATDPPQE